MPHSPSIDNARWLVSLSPLDISSDLVCLSDAIDLISGRSQTRDTVTINVAFPGQKFVDRELVEAAHLVDRNPAAAYSLDDRRLAAHRPSRARVWQFRHAAEHRVRGIIDCRLVAYADVSHFDDPPKKGTTLAGLH